MLLFGGFGVRRRVNSHKAQDAERLQETPACDADGISGFGGFHKDGIEPSPSPRER